ncbi:MAG: hypothetical protein L6Q99_20400 [Planctomycetes bacterium]|nr:hypothetical protein [Planctomycetota bacterium]
MSKFAHAFTHLCSASVLASAASAQVTPGTYDVRLLAKTGDATTSGVLTSIDPYVSINDAGWLAFSGSDSASSRCFVWKSGAVQGVTFANPNRLFEGAAINNQVPPQVASRDRITSGSTLYFERTWPSDGSQAYTLVGASPTDFDSGQLNVDLNDSGVMCFVANVNGGTSTALFAGAAQPPKQLRVYAGFPPLRPAISNTNVIVIRDGNGDISGVQYPSGAALAYSAGGGFIVTGRKPGISSDGRAVAFVGAQGGPEGIFVSLQASAGQSLHRIAGGGADTFTDFLDLERVGVVSTGDTLSGQIFTVAFLGTQAGETGLYTVESTALEIAGVVTVTSKVPRRVVKLGSSVGGKTIASLGLHDSPNAGGVIGFFASFSDGSQGVLRASPEVDTDGDGLFDSWELQGIDFDDNGVVDLDLPALKAKKDHKDLFVEIDAMLGRQPTAATLDQVVAAFATAPNAAVKNPDGVDGVSLHYQNDEGDIALAPFQNSFQEFDALKAVKFGTPAERASPNWSAIREAKRMAFRYCIFADQHSGGSSSGRGELPGNDFMVTLGHPSWGANGGTIGGTPDQQAGTFMHELGHTLGLLHGGSDSIHRKPNFRSVMNYTWQNPWPYNQAFWQLDYSRAAFQTLGESALNELTGIGGDPAVVVLAGPKPERLVPEAGPVDWDADGTANGAAVAADVNFVLDNPAQPAEQLVSREEWSTLVYDFREGSDFADGVHLTDTGLIELTAADSLAAFAVCLTPTVYCSAKVNSLGCTPRVTITGSTSLSGPDDLVITVDQVLNRRRGVILWSRKSGLQPFGGGTLCIVGAQLRALPIGSSGGSALPTVDCSGVYSAAFTHAYLAAQGVVAGDMLFAQCWSRDPGFAEPDNIGLSAAAAFLVCP